MEKSGSSCYNGESILNRGKKLMKKHTTIRTITFSGIIAALYVAITLLTSSFAYGPIQFRIAEALSVFCCFEPLAVPGVILGCLISNFFSPVSVLDIFVGTAATVIASLLMTRCKKVWLMPIPNVAANGLLVGALLAFTYTPDAFWQGFWTFCAEVALGELAVMCVIGIPLFLWLKKSDVLKKLI